MNLTDMFIEVRVKGRLTLALISGMLPRIVERTWTRTEEREKRAGAPTAMAKKMNIIYIRTFDDALFSMKAFSRMFTAVSSRRIAMFPPDFIPEFITPTVLFILSEFILFDIS